MTKCRVCGNEHSGGCAQFFAEQSAREARAVKPRKVVDTTRSAKPAVVDVAAVVVDRNRDRHRLTPVRREYLRVKQRESRARRRVS